MHSFFDNVMAKLITYLKYSLSEVKQQLRLKGGKVTNSICLYTAVSRKVVQEKRTRQGRKVLRVMGFLVIDWRFRLFSDTDGNSTNKCIYAFSFLVGRHPWTSINERQTRSTHNTNWHYRARFYAFVGQPLSKQLLFFCFYFLKHFLLQVTSDLRYKNLQYIITVYGTYATKQYYTLLTKKQC